MLDSLNHSIALIEGRWVRREEYNRMISHYFGHWQEEWRKTDQTTGLSSLCKQKKPITECKTWRNCEAGPEVGT